MKRIQFILWGVLLVAVFSCKHLPPLENLSTNFVVITKYDTSVDFKQYKTYSIRDTIETYTGNPNDSIWDDQNAQSIINQVRTEMAAYGYSEVPIGAHPDLGLMCAALKNTTLFAVPPGWWWGYPGWAPPCYWGYCGGWGYWYPYYFTVSVSTGTFIIEMADLKNAVKDGKINIVWDGVGAGQIGSSTSFVVSQCIRTAQQGFLQSPYLKIN